MCNAFESNYGVPAHHNQGIFAGNALVGLHDHTSPSSRAGQRLQDNGGAMGNFGANSNHTGREGRQSRSGGRSVRFNDLVDAGEIPERQSLAAGPDERADRGSSVRFGGTVQTRAAVGQMPARTHTLVPHALSSLVSTPAPRGSQGGEPVQPLWLYEAPRISLRNHDSPQPNADAIVRAFQGSGDWERIKWAGAMVPNVRRLKMWFPVERLWAEIILNAPSNGYIMVNDVVTALREVSRGTFPRKWDEVRMLCDSFEGEM
ncbi:hypothetical protein DXG01_011429 [Tephrocybe rancida]|nr:hypothetical protein DXG01_011429 [Tephrocybe rancida]